MYDNNKDKRISMLSFYSSNCNLKAGDGSKPIDIYLQTKQVNDQLYNDYPITEEPRNKPVHSSEPTDKCPDCGGEMKYKTGTKNNKEWRGMFCQNKECKKVVWLPKPTTSDNSWQSAQDSANWGDNKQNYEHGSRESF